MAERSKECCKVQYSGKKYKTGNKGNQEGEGRKRRREREREEKERDGKEKEGRKKRKSKKKQRTEKCRTKLEREEAYERTKKLEGIIL